MINIILTSCVAVLAVAILVYMLLKKNDIKMTLMLLGLILMYIALFMGHKIEVTEKIGTVWLTPIQALVDQFSSTLVGPGFVILILGGYSAYMSSIGANDVTVSALTKPIKKIKSVYILVPIVFLIGNLLSLVIPSASNLAIILLATLYPVLRAAGMSRLTAGAIIATSATIVPTPLGSDNVAIANQLNMPVAQYVFQYHAMISIPTLLLIAVVHYFWQRHEDAKHDDTMSYEQETKGNHQGDDAKVCSNKSGLTNFIYGVLPLMPIIILLTVFILNAITGSTLNLSVQLVSLMSLLFAIVVELFVKKDIKSVLQETNNFFNGMGNVMGIVALLVAAQVFVQGLTSLGVIDLIQKLMENINGAGLLLPIIMVVLTAAIVLLSGSGMALLFALIPLIVPLAKASGISPEALSVPMQLSGNLLRAVSPVAAVVLIVSGHIKLSPMEIVRRTSVPMFAGLVMAVILSLILL